MPQGIRISKSALAIAGAVISFVLAAALAVHLYSRRQARIEPYIRAATTYVKDNAQIVERVGSPVFIEVTECHFGLGSKDPQLLEGLGLLDRNIADAIVWVDCRVTGPKGEEHVAAWLLSKRNASNVVLLRLLMADGTDRETVQKLLPQFAGKL